MSLHDEIYESLITDVMVKHYATFAKSGTFVVDGSNIQDGTFEPYMHRSCFSVLTEQKGIKTLAVVFKAGIDDDPYQSMYMFLDEGTTQVIFKRSEIDIEFSLCEIYEAIIHLLINILANERGLTHTCCFCDDGEPFSKSDPVSVGSVVRLKPTLSVVKNDGPVS